MSHTFNWQKQPIVSCKDKSTNSVIPTWSRPYTNTDVEENIGIAFKARPIKHWRKQLFPRNNSGRTGIGIPMDLPGGASYIGEQDECNLNASVIKENIVNNNENCCNNQNIVDSRKNIIRRANTNLNYNVHTEPNKKYYTDSMAYLKARCRTYNQNMSGTIKEDSLTEERNILSCSNNNCPTTLATTVYKPNNKKYGVQGAVSSSERLLRLKVNTVNVNGASFKSAYGLQAANAGRYHGTSEAPYFLKSKENKCSSTNYYRKGSHTACFHSSSDKIGNKA